MLWRKKRKIFLFRSDSSGHSTWEGLSHDFRALPHSYYKEKSFTFYLWSWRIRCYCVKRERYFFSVPIPPGTQRGKVYLTILEPSPIVTAKKNLSLFTCPGWGKVKCWGGAGFWLNYYAALFFQQDVI